MPTEPARTTIVLALAALLARPVQASEIQLNDIGLALWEASSLMEVKYDAEHVKWLNPTRESGFETSEGVPVSLRRWYSARVRNTSVAWLTQLSPSFGVVWGLGTGERGAKYTITPSAKLGLVAQHEVVKNGWLSIKVTTILGGKLKEKSCSGDYGELGGVQEVNCRFAASILAPAETLTYLFREKPFNRHQLLLQFSHRF